MRHHRAPPPVPTGLCGLADVEKVSLALLGARAAALVDVLGGARTGAGSTGFASGPLAPRLARIAALAALEQPPGGVHSSAADAVPAFAWSRLPARVAGVDGAGPPLPPAVARVVDAALADPATIASPGASFGAWASPWMAPATR